MRNRRRPGVYFYKRLRVLVLREGHNHYMFVMIFTVVFQQALYVTRHLTEFQNFEYSLIQLCAHFHWQSPAVCDDLFGPASIFDEFSL